MSDDSGEMVAASVRLGLPHPPGYPLFDLLGRLASFLPVGTPAFRFNLLSSVLALASLGLVLSCCREMMVRSPSFFPANPLFRSALLFLAGAALFFDRDLMGQAMTAKGAVYLLSLLGITALFRFRLGRGSGEGGWARAGRTAVFLFALGFTNHWQTQAALVPFGALWAWEERARWSVKEAFLSAALVLTALSPYLYLPLRAHAMPWPDWGHPDEWRRFLWVVTRQLASQEEWTRGWGHYLAWGGEYLRLMAGSWWPGFWLAVLAGAGVLYFADRRIFFSSAALYGPVLWALLTVPRDETLYLLKVYLVSIDGTAAFLGFLGLAFLLARMERWPLAPWLFLASLFTIAAGWGWWASAAEDKSRYTIAEDMGTNVLRGVPRDGLLLAEGDHYVMPIFYQKYVLGLRPDMAFEPALFLVHDWGWRQLAVQGPGYREAVEGSPLFTGRLGAAARAAMTKGGLHYSLQSRKLEGPLRGLGGEWVPEGLTMAWKGRAGPKDEVEGVRTRVLGQRLRGLGNYRSDPDLDLSSSQIYLYYADGYFRASRYLASKGFGVLAGELYKAGLEMGSVSARARAREGLE